MQDVQTNFYDDTFYKVPVEKLNARRTEIDKRIGIAEGKLEPPKDFDRCDEEIAAMFGVVP